MQHQQLQPSQGQQQLCPVEAQCAAAADLPHPPPRLRSIERPRDSAAAAATTEDSMEGCSPTTSSEYSSSGLEVLCSRQQHCARTQQRPRRAVLRWVVSQLQRIGDQQQADNEQRYPQSLVSGSSFDSLEALDHHLPLHTPTFGLTLQQAGTSTIHEAQPGRVQRCFRALLRPVVRLVSRAARVVASCAGPQGPGNNDNSMAERVVNVLTSLPFIAVGLHGLRHRRSGRGRHFALSFLLVGAVASGYHGADRSSWLRPVMRKLDYYTICYTSTVMRRAAHIPLPRGLALLSAVVAPLKPTAVTGLNLALVESKYLRTALAHAHLWPSFKTHIASAVIGIAAFCYEDIATDHWGWPPVLHSLWHCLSAVAMGCTHCLLGHVEVAAALAEGMQL